MLPFYSVINEHEQNFGAFSYIMRVKSSIAATDIAQLICIIRPFVSVTLSKGVCLSGKRLPHAQGWRIELDTFKLNTSLKKKITATAAESKFSGVEFLEAIISN